MTAINRQSRHLPAFILLALAERPLHGHAIQVALNQRIPGFKSESAAIYRTLQALEADGDVVFQWDTESRGPARKVYSLTDGGWARLDFWEEDIAQRLVFLNTFMDLLKDARLKRPQE